MTFVSYAQNFEDVMLWRALKNIQNGFYIDVGANDPEVDSVTKVFYDRGWTGINIEPLSEHHKALAAARTRDINLKCAVGAARGELELWECDVRGWATLDQAAMQQHERNGHAGRLQTVPVMTLTEIFAQYVSGDVHFLKIDVEGFEKAVLEGTDFSICRPWVIVIEATQPDSTVEVHKQWENLLLVSNYQFAYADGLNRYYVADEHADLLPSFSYPPNVFDAFVLADVIEARKRTQQTEATLQQAEATLQQAEITLQQTEIALQQTEATLQQTEATLQQTEAGLHHWKVEAEQANAEQQRLAQMLDAMYASTSWRLTAPLRWLGWQRIALKEQGVKTRLLLALKKPVRVLGHRALPWLERYPRLRTEMKRLLKACGMDAYAMRFFRSIQAEQAKMQSFIAPHIAGQGLGPDEFNRLAYPRHPRAPFLPAHNAGGTRLVPRFYRFVGHIEGHYSLAAVNRGLAVAMHTMNKGHITFQPYHGTAYNNPTDIPVREEASLRAMIATQIPDAESGNVVSIVHHYPFISDQHAAKHRFMLFFWEETSVPFETICHINTHFDAVLVASSFVWRALRNSGCRHPVFIIPLGIDHLIDAPSQPDAAASRCTDKPFRFLHVSSAFERKGVDVLLQAYLTRFTKADPVELYIKTFPNPHNTVRQQLHSLIAGRTDAPSVVVDEANLTTDEMVALYRSAQTLVLPTRGEGFNLSAAEGMALGLPVIVTGYGGQSDFCTLDTAFLLPYRFAPSRSHLRASDACWVEPDAGALGTMMNNVRHALMDANPDLTQQLQRAAAYVRQTYTWANAAHAVQTATAMLDALPRQSQAKRMAVISSWQTRCGIAEYTQRLLSAPSWAEWDLQIYCDTRTASTQASNQVHISWTLGHTEMVLKAIDLAVTDGVDAFLVQHQPSLFKLGGSVSQRLRSISQSGVVVLLELHSTMPLLGPLRLNDEDIANLKQLDRIIVHSADDMNNLLNLGVTDNVMLLPLGVLALDPTISASRTRAQLQLEDDDLVLATFGFLLPHKGVDTLIRSLGPLSRATGKRVRLIALNALMDKRSDTLLQEYQALARQLDVFQHIVWVNDFHPIEDCLDLLALADYIVFPYRATQESASAAVTIGVAARRPVLVSPLKVFADLDDCVYAMHGDTKDDVVQAICDLHGLPGHHASQLERQEHWLNERSWSRISVRLSDTVYGLLLDRKTGLHDASTLSQPLAHALFVDVSELYCRDARTGIQRVVRSILHAWLTNPPAGYQVFPVYATKGEQYRYTDKFATSSVAPTSQLDRQFIQPEAGDIFVGLDLTAHLFPEVESVLTDLRDRGVKICYVIYDLIPVLFPHWCDKGLPEAFSRWLEGLARHADTLVGISAAVAEDVRQVVNGKLSPRRALQINHFHLGADIAHSLPTTGLPDDAEQVLQKLAARPSLLMVGTIEMRKGHAQTLAAFEQLWQEGLEVNLVLVGKPGWGVNGLIKQLNEHAECGDHLFWLPGISDEYLERIYAACTVLIAASEGEGFGLPLIEAAQHKLPIIARDIPVFREVAGEHAFYFTGLEAEYLAVAIRRWLELHSQGKIPLSDNMRWLTWQQSAEQLLQAILPAEEVNISRERIRRHH